MIDAGEDEAVLAALVMDDGAVLMADRGESETVVAQLGVVPEQDNCRYEIVEAVATVITSIKDRK